MRQPRDEWHVYGDYRVSGRAGHSRTANDFDDEERAWRHAIELRLKSEVCNIVIVHVTHRPGIGAFTGKWRAVRTVIWRCGMGRAWFE